MLKKIRVTIFFTDIEIANIVKNSGVNTKLVSWANEFFKKYNYELDIFPIPYSKDLYEQTFILMDTDGTMVPFHFLEGIYKLEARSDKLSKEIIKLNREKKITDELVMKQLNLQQMLNEFRNQLTESYLKIRVQCHYKYRDDFPDKNPARLVVVYCRSEQPQYITSGETINNAGSWSPFVVIPVVGGKDDLTPVKMLLNKAYNTLAFEIIHAAGGQVRSPKGGYYEGGKKSIMNSDTFDLLPNNIILEKKDLALLDTAIFTT